MHSGYWVYGTSHYTKEFLKTNLQHRSTKLLRSTHTNTHTYYKKGR